MAKMNEIIKKWADFSASETKPLFWMLLGPLLVMLTLIVAIPNFSNPYLPLLTVMGFVLSWKYRFSGLSLTLMVFVVYFAFNYFLGHHDAFLWKLGWGCSLALGLTISFLSMEELKSYYAKQKEAKEKALQELHISLNSFEEKTATEKRSYENEIDTLKDELSSSRDEGEVLLTLVDASRLESDKAMKQSETLTQEVIDREHELSQAQDDLEKLEERMAQLTVEHRSIEEIATERLKELNQLRVEVYQAKLLAETYQKQVEKARAYFKAQKKEGQPLQPPPPPEDKTNILKTLEQDKAVIKKAYDQMLHDYQALKGAPEAELKEKKAMLERTKSELVGIEREIFILKKGLQEKGSYTS
ncbi:MAG: hypothetical protein H7A38_02365 [Chlamydiales bacterium]|nr:hypothetical protein [Chlamydiales bacterium]